MADAEGYEPLHSSYPSNPLQAVFTIGDAANNLSNEASIVRQAPVAPVADFWDTVQSLACVSIHVVLMNPGRLPQTKTSDGKHIGNGHRMTLPTGLSDDFVFGTGDLISKILNGKGNREISFTLPLSNVDICYFYGLKLTRYDRNTNGEIGSLAAELKPGRTVSLGDIDDFRDDEVWKLRIVRCLDRVHLRRHMWAVPVSEG
jgi:hypothetical protein